MNPPSPTSDATAWWNPVTVPVGEARRWRIGPLAMWAHRRTHEWRIYHRSGDDPVDETLEPAAVAPLADVPEGDAEVTAVRYSFGRTPRGLGLMPRLADRPVIVRPAHTMVLPAQEAATLYVSTPLWVAISTIEPSHPLDEWPCFRPSDTWFGPSTTIGELCYASRTTGRLELTELPLRPHRAVTPIRIQNRAREALPIDRLKVPVQLLSLHATARGLWTPSVSLVRTEGTSDEVAELQLAKEPPREAGVSRLVAGPRERAEGALGLRAFSRLLGLGGAS